jgi:hypothetical protein
MLGMIAPTCQVERRSPRLSVVRALPFAEVQSQRAPETRDDEAPQQFAPTDIERDSRIAKALRLRRATIHDEILSCARQREEAYRRADAFLDEAIELDATDKGLRTALMAVERRLQRAGAYFVTDTQLSTILDQIANVGADPRRFCAFMGVDAVALIPAHEYDEALAALEAKRRRAA